MLTCPSSGNAWHLKSRHPFVPAAQQLISSSEDYNRSAALWAYHWWNAEWLKNTTRFRTFILDIGTHPLGMTLLKTPWVQLIPPLYGCRTSPPLLTQRGMSFSAVHECDHVVSVQSIDIPMGCMAWQFKLTWQSNSCSIPPRDPVPPNYGLQQLAQTIKIRKMCFHEQTDLVLTKLKVWNQLCLFHTHSYYISDFLRNLKLALFT